MTTISVDELERRLREVLSQVQAGDSVLIARDGHPVAELAPCDEKARVEKAFPGALRAAAQMREFRFERVPLTPGPDIVDVLRDVRDDRDLLP